MWYGGWLQYASSPKCFLVRPLVVKYRLILSGRFLEYWCQCCVFLLRLAHPYRATCHCDRYFNCRRLPKTIIFSIAGKQLERD